MPELTTYMNMRIPLAVKEALERRASEEGRPVSEVARRVLAEGLGVELARPWKRQQAEETALAPPAFRSATERAEAARAALQQAEADTGVAATDWGAG